MLFLGYVYDVPDEIVEQREGVTALGTTDPTLMAGGISVALVTTAAGLSVAIPTMLVQGLLKGRGDRLIADGRSRRGRDPARHIEHATEPTGRPGTC